MKTRMIMAAVAAGLTVMASWAAEPAQEVQNAASKLAEKESYSWTATTKLGGESRFEPRPWQGKTAGESGTIITTTGRDDQEIKVAIQGEKRWMKTDEGWQSLAELAQGEQGGRGGFMARLMRDYKLPVEEAKNLAAKTTNLKKEGNAYIGELTKEGARDLVMRGFRRGQSDDQGPNVTGTTKFWVKDGVLSKYEYNVKGKLRFGQDGREFDLDRTTTVEIKDAGSTQVEWPAELK